jgi:hypothetical protein
MSGSITGQSSVSSVTESISPQCALVLWNVFIQRVEPLVRIIFRWAIDELRAKSTNTQDQKPISSTEHALVQAIYYASANTLTDDECTNLLQLPRSVVVAQCQARCEDALLQTNLFCMNDLDTIKAVTFYIVCIAVMRKYHKD